MTYAVTTSGRLSADQLGLVLPHEHLLFDLTAYLTSPMDEEEERLANAELTLANSAHLRRSPLVSRQNLELLDEEVASTELGYFREVGGGTVVDCTLPEMGRDVEAAARIADRSGVNVIVVTGHYVASTMSTEVRAQSVDEMTAWMMGELREGIDGSAVRAGAIKVGLTSVGRMPEEERRCLVAAAQAQSETGAPITVHNPVPFEKRGVEVMRQFVKAGADPERVVMGHMTHSVPDEWYHRSVMDTGATVEFDRFGQELYQEAGEGFNRWGPYAGEPRDSEVVAEIRSLVQAGYVDRILMSHDIGFRNGLRAFGGFGYAHVPYRIARYLRQVGLDDDDLEQLMVRNPARLFAYEA
ncbi:MAG: aryldialkylphosphatase [Acidimicrobiaceae bacterium]|nr:aryldialkylphosphatase [Acidimicrobiaceae bacterium]